MFTIKIYLQNTMTCIIAYTKNIPCVLCYTVEFHHL